MITATLTRPTSIGTKVSPKTSCERKIYLVEKVDVGSLAPPRPSTIYLEPISKRPKKKRQPGVSAERISTAADPVDAASDVDSTRANENSTEGSLSVVGEDQGPDHPGNPRSPVQSDVRSVSSDSAVSRSTGPSRGGDTNHVLAFAPSSRKASAVKERTITATIELQRGGCLPGDVVPIKISVQHIRTVKSIHGVIVTLYRLGRIDSSPWLLSKELSEAESRRAEDEYYPKSKTGLGGLSLSAAGSCSVFRKDLSQSISPLIINPETLAATLTASVRVPEDVFPTIKGVPYEMITFKYHVEVIVDLGGKLAKQIQGGKPSGARMSTVGGPLGLTSNSFDGGSASLASWGTGIIDTDRLRRQKGVISVVFEAVVGTTDSSRFRGKGPLKPTPSVYSVPVPEADFLHNGRSEKQPWPVSPENNGYMPDGYPGDHDPSSPAHQSTYATGWNPVPPPPPQQPPPAPVPHYIPPPEVPDESTLTEKERIRRAEQRLLPSEPPESEPPAIAGPSSSHLPNGENIYDADDDADGRPAPPLPPAPLPDVDTPHMDQAEPPSAPTLEDLSLNGAPPQHSHYHQPPTEDKQELERRRLLAEASVPPEFPDDYDIGIGPSAPPPPPPSMPQASPPLLSGAVAVAAAEADLFQPSAPALLLMEEGGVGNGEGSSSHGHSHGHGHGHGHEDGDEEATYGRHYAYADAPAVGREGSSRVLAGRTEPLPRYER